MQKCVSRTISLKTADAICSLVSWVDFFSHIFTASYIHLKYVKRSFFHFHYRLTDRRMDPQQKMLAMDTQRIYSHLRLTENDFMNIIKNSKKMAIIKKCYTKVFDHKVLQNHYFDQIMV